MITNEECYITVSKDGFIKRFSQRAFDANEGQVPFTKDDDYLIGMRKCETVDTLLVFSSKGTYAQIPVYTIDECRFKDPGKPISNYVKFDGFEKFVGAVVLKTFDTLPSIVNQDVDDDADTIVISHGVGTVHQGDKKAKLNQKIVVHVSGRAIMPVSGSEITYNPSLWNNPSIQRYTNCYAYALNTQVYPNTNNRCYLQPGSPLNEYGNTVPQQYISLQNIVDKVEHDSEVVGFTFYQIDKYDTCPVGTYKVALAIDNSVDYHWYRQDADGYWSHKPGTTPASFIDDSDNLILDPAVADRGDYTNFLGYFAVSSWGNYYHE